MLLYYVRHGDPTYDPDDLTPLGLRQAEAVGRRLSRYGLDEIYASPLVRAQKTAKPASEITKKPIHTLDWISENAAWKQLSVKVDQDHTTWFFATDEVKRLFMSKEVRRMGDDWIDLPCFKNTTIPEGFNRIKNKTREFMTSIGFEYDEDAGMYKNLHAFKPDRRIAVFAHHGAGTCFLSALLDVPYPIICEKTYMMHSGITVVYFDETQEMIIPSMLTLSDGGHLLADNMTEFYDNRVFF